MLKEKVAVVILYLMLYGENNFVMLQKPDFWVKPQGYTKRSKACNKQR